jgi:hypothetical protein
MGETYEGSHDIVPAEIRTAKFPKNKPEISLREETLSEGQY